MLGLNKKKKKKEKNLDNPCAKDLMNPRVYMLPSTENFRTLIQLMQEKNISAVFINDINTRNFYVISHTDIVEFLYKKSIEIEKKQNIKDNIENKDNKMPKAKRIIDFEKDVCNILLSELMRGPVDILDEKSSIEEIIRYMNLKGYKRVLLGNKGIPTGVLSTKDILSWNDKYFKSGLPFILLVVDKESSIVISQYIFKENIKNQINPELIELYGGVLNSVNAITDELLKNDSNDELEIIKKENYTILLEHYEEISGVLICNNPSLELRRKLKSFIKNFYHHYEDIIKSPLYKETKPNLQVNKFISIF
ncbi:MAG: CBS domain-containing protein [Promethearchaeota archaeon]